MPERKEDHQLEQGPRYSTGLYKAIGTLKRNINGQKEGRSEAIITYLLLGKPVLI